MPGMLSCYKHHDLVAKIEWNVVRRGVGLQRQHVFEWVLHWQ